jgi:hypothetical protein
MSTPSTDSIIRPGIGAIPPSFQQSQPELQQQAPKEHPPESQGKDQAQSLFHIRSWQPQDAKRAKLDTGAPADPATSGPPQQHAYELRDAHSTPLSSSQEHNLAGEHPSTINSSSRFNLSPPRVWCFYNANPRLKILYHDRHGLYHHPDA